MVRLNERLLCKTPAPPVVALGNSQSKQICTEQGNQNNTYVLLKLEEDLEGVVIPELWV